MTFDIAPEFSRVVRPSALSADPSARAFDIEASPAECAALAERFGFLALDYLRGSVRLDPVRGGKDFHLAGHLAARVVQSCVVTLDPVTSEIERDFDLHLCEDEGDMNRLAEIGDDYELYSGDAIDIGEVVAVEVALGVDPYPHVPGVSGETETGMAGDESRGNRPFEGLTALMRPE